jgi:hypothetical protein
VSFHIRRFDDEVIRGWPTFAHRTIEIQATRFSEPFFVGMLPGRIRFNIAIAFSKESPPITGRSERWHQQPGLHITEPFPFWPLPDFTSQSSIPSLTYFTTAIGVPVCPPGEPSWQGRLALQGLQMRPISYLSFFREQDQSVPNLFQKNDHKRRVMI